MLHFCLKTLHVRWFTDRTTSVNLFILLKTDKRITKIRKKKYLLRYQSDLWAFIFKGLANSNRSVKLNLFFFLVAISNQLLVQLFINCIFILVKRRKKCQNISDLLNMLSLKCRQLMFEQKIFASQLNKITNTTLKNEAMNFLKNYYRWSW